MQKYESVSPRKGRGVVVGIVIGADAFVQAHATKVVKEKGVERQTHLLAHMPDKQAAVLVATKSMAQKTFYLERGIYIDLSRDASVRIDNGGL